MTDRTAAPLRIARMSPHAMLASGEVDVCDLIAEPERFGELGEAAREMTLGELVAAEPKLEDGDLDDEAWLRAGLDPATPLRALDHGDREWVADVLRFWRVRPRDVSTELSEYDYI